MNNIHDTIAALWISKKNWHFKKYGVFPPENWHHIHLPSPAPLGRGVDNTTAIGRATEVDIRTGWAGHLTPREIKDRWSRHGSVIPANHMDNHLNGTSCASFEKIRWGALWISRASAVNSNKAEETGLKKTLLAHRMSYGEEKMTKPKVEQQREKLWDKLLNFSGGAKR